MGNSGLGLEDFLNEENRASRGNWMKNWKDDPGFVVVWLHALARIHGRWQHQFPYVDTIEDKETRAVSRVLRFERFGCWESEDVLLKRRFRDDVTGEREAPPAICPLCLLEEALVQDQKIPDNDEVFRVAADERRDGRAHVASFLKGNVTGVFEKTATSWMESISPRKTYLFTVVNNAKPADGVLVTAEAQALGDSLKQVIKQERDSKGVEAGNPYQNPYAFKWVYAKKASPKDKYTAYRYDQAVLTEEIRALITSEPVPDLTAFCARGDARRLKVLVEEAMTSNVIDLDAIFERSLTEQAKAKPEGAGKAQQAVESRTPRPARVPAATDAPAVPGRRKKVEAPKPAPVPTMPCDDCKAPMLATDTKCPKCGAEYEIDAAAQPAAAPVEQARPASQSAQQVPSATEPDPFAGFDDDIPFVWLLWPAFGFLPFLQHVLA